MQKRMASCPCGRLSFGLSESGRVSDKCVITSSGSMETLRGDRITTRCCSVSGPCMEVDGLIGHGRLVMSVWDSQSLEPLDTSRVTSLKEG